MSEQLMWVLQIVGGDAVTEITGLRAGWERDAFLSDALERLR